MRQIVLYLIALWSVPLYAQVSPVSAPPPPMHVLIYMNPDGSPAHFSGVMGADGSRSAEVRSDWVPAAYGAGVLGGGIGLLLGLGIRSADPVTDDPYYAEEYDYALLQAIAPAAGLFIGSTAGVLAVTQPDAYLDASGLLSLGFGELTGALVGWQAADALTRGSEVGAGVGAVLGASAGAVLGVILWEHAIRAEAD